VPRSFFHVPNPEGKAGIPEVNAASSEGKNMAYPARSILVTLTVA